MSFKTGQTLLYATAAGSNWETANASVSATSRQTSSCSVSTRMSHGQFENMIIYCTTAAVLAEALAPLAEAPFSLVALKPSSTSNSHTVCFTLRYKSDTLTHTLTESP